MNRIRLLIGIVGILASAHMAQAFSASKSYSQGNNYFGYSLNAWVGDHSYAYPSYTWYNFEGNASATAKLIGRNYTMVKFDAGVDAYRDAKVKLYADIYFFGNHLMDIDKTTSGKQTISYRYSKSFSAPQVPIPVGPIPVYVSAGVSGSIVMAETFEGFNNPAKVSIGPEADFADVVSAGVGGTWASVGVEGKLSLLKIKLKGEASAYLSSKKAVFSAYLTKSTMDGSLGLFAKAGPWKYTYTLGSWNGSSSTSTLANGTWYW
jgi:hypothetical protein